MSSFVIGSQTKFVSSKEKPFFFRSAAQEKSRIWAENLVVFIFQLGTMNSKMLEETVFWRLRKLHDLSWKYKRVMLFLV